MQIYQEVSSVADSSLNAGLITNKRSLETNVIVDDGQIIVLGGLVEDKATNGIDKVPLLGDIPVVGSLFRSEKRQRTKTNLMVFLRPYVIRDASTSSSIVMDRYDYMRAVGHENAPKDHWLLPNMQTPDLAPLDAKGTVKPPASLIAPDKPAADKKTD